MPLKILIEFLAHHSLGTAFIFSDIFDEYIYHSENNLPVSSQNSQEVDAIDNAAFEVPLNTLIECLNIFGSAGTMSTTTINSNKYKKWKKASDDSDRDDENDGRGKGGTRGIDSYFGGGSDKRTGMRMSYAGAGYPLTLLL